MSEFQILSRDYFEDFKNSLDENFEASFLSIKSKPMDSDSFTFYNSVAVVFSSRIEGEKIEFGDYLNYKLLKNSLEDDLIEKPDDLFKAYIFAQREKLKFDNFFKAHSLLSKTLLPQEQQGRMRFGQKVISAGKDGKITYEACQASDVPKEFRKLFEDIDYLLKKDLTLEESFYFASYIHLVFVKIHPFDDGNGRSARLLEKWFLARKLDIAVWSINSEKYYHDHLMEYYKNLEDVGFFYDDLDYGKANGFLGMLSKSISYK